MITTDPKPFCQAVTVGERCWKRQHADTELHVVFNAAEPRFYHADGSLATEAQILDELEPLRGIDPRRGSHFERLAAQPPRLIHTLIDIARARGFTGDSCPDCGRLELVRNGTCAKCTACGATTGCS